MEDQFPFDPIERPFAYQIFDNNIYRIEETALHLLKYQPDFIDINMGCSNRSVSARGAGAGLMREPLKIAKLFSRLTKILPIPVTAKIRLGWDETEINYLEIAKILQDNGCSCISLHARTRTQQYSGKADWDSIARLVQQVKIPVIGNGDVRHFAHIDEMISYTKCDAVMIGRAAIGNPWIFTDIQPEQIVPAERLRIIIEHLRLMLAYYGQIRGVILFRKHLTRYLDIPLLSKEQIRTAYRFDTADDLAQYLQEIMLGN
jgi:nifR3 family TIM-barrel protein